MFGEVGVCVFRLLGLWGRRGEVAKSKCENDRGKERPDGEGGEALHAAGCEAHFERCLPSPNTIM